MDDEKVINFGQPRNGKRPHGQNEGDPRINAVLARIVSAASIAEKAPYVPQWDVPTLLPSEDAPACIFGLPETLKSWLMLHLCHCIATGARFLGKYQVKQRPRVLYLNLDSGPNTFENRIRKVSASDAFDVLSIGADEYNDKLLRRLLGDYAGGFVVIDCFASIYPSPGRGDDASDHMRNFVIGLRRLYAEAGCGGAIVDHSRRPKDADDAGDFYGNGQKLASFRSMWQLIGTPPVPGEPRRTTILCRKMSEGEPFAPVPAVITFAEDSVHFGLGIAVPYIDRAANTKKRMIEWAELATDTFTQFQIVKAVSGISSGKLTERREIFQKLVADGTFQEAGKRGSGITYRLAHQTDAMWSHAEDHMEAKN